MSYFQRDLNNEKILGHYLDDIYKSLSLNFERIDDIDLQHKGIDLIFKDKENTYIDEKAQLDYLNEDLPTFTFELSYLKNNIKKTGWLLDEHKITTHYFLITGIFVNNIKDLTEGIITCKITSVNRNKLINYLNSINLNKDTLTNYEESIRNSNEKLKRLTLKELNPNTQGILFYSSHLEEKPINLQLRLSYLINLKIAKKIFPT